MFAGVIAYAMMMSGPVTVPDGNLKISWDRLVDGAGAGSGVMEGEYGPVAFFEENEVAPGFTSPGLWHWAATNPDLGYFYLYVGSVPIGTPPPQPVLFGNGGFRPTFQSNAPFTLQYTRTEPDGSLTVLTITK